MEERLSSGHVYWKIVAIVKIKCENKRHMALDNWFNGNIQMDAGVSLLK